MRWGDPILPGTGGLNSDFSNVTPEQQAGAFGYNNDFVAYLPATRDGDESDVGLLWVNHEYTNPELMFAGYDPRQPHRRPGRHRTERPTAAPSSRSTPVGTAA